MCALLSTVYCSEAEMDRFLSPNGVIARADHDPLGGASDTDVVEDAINYATEEIDLYARQRYAQTELTGSTLINRWCVIMACRFLSQTRGNPVPDSIESEFTRIIERLEMVADGRRQLPGIALRADLRPTMSNLTVDRRYRRSTIRVTHTNSSDPSTSLTQDRVRDIPGVFD